MKRRLILLAGLSLLAMAIWIGYPKFRQIRNVEAEYETAAAIEALKLHLQYNGGLWPTSPDELGSRYNGPTRVVIDYGVTSDFLIRSPDALREAVHPDSQVFYTYPHYDAKLEELHSVLVETNRKRTSQSR